MLKFSISLLTASLFMSGCLRHELSVIVSNSLDFDRDKEMVSIEATDITEKYGNRFIIKDEKGKEIPWQITHDGKLIFQADVKARASSEYTFSKGIPETVPDIVTGIFRSDCQDDIAWENEHCGYRLYGPSFRATGGKVYGYDIWSKCVSYPLVEKLYDDDHKRGISYHVNHGEGFDGYTVGPTLGGGMCALVDSLSRLVYPCAYRKYEFLDNGPLRVKIRFEIDPVVVNGDSVTETRVVTLDAGAWLNKTDVSYSGLSSDTPVASGIVVHTDNPGYNVSSEKYYVSYSDRTDNVSAGNGDIFVGVVCSNTDSVGYRPFHEIAANALGEIVLYNTYHPGMPHTYRWGSSWSRGDVKNEKEWIELLEKEAQKVTSPLQTELLR